MYSSRDISALLEWFERDGISYPWGENPTPYRVWISEVMLQQTTVKAVLPYFDRWMQGFPSLEALAEAEEDSVLSMWEGHGYYSRARNILKASRIIRDQYNGIFPETEKQLLELPGIGPYTCAAIRSIAFGYGDPVMDANVRRILQRLSWTESWTEKNVSEWLEQLKNIYPGNKAGECNAALMQLGQLICKNRNPLCGSCPLKKSCKASEKPDPSAVPKKKKLSKIKKRSRLLLLRDRDSLFMYRKENGIGKGLWSFPEAEEESIKNAEEVKELTPRYHLYTRYKDLLVPVMIEKDLYQNKDLPRGEWIRKDRLEKIPVPSVYRKIINEASSFLENSD